MLKEGELYKRIFNFLPVASILVEGENIKKLNNAFEHLTGFKRNEIIGKQVRDLVRYTLENRAFLVTARGEYILVSFKRKKLGISGYEVYIFEKSGTFKTKRELKRSQQLYAILSGINRLVMGSYKLDEVFKESVKIITLEGLFKYAGIFKKSNGPEAEKGNLSPELVSVCIPFGEDYVLVVGKEGGEEFEEDELVLLYEIASDLNFLVNRLKEKGTPHSTDSVTGFPNRFAFFRELTKVIESKSLKALILIDIDNFSEINTAFGYQVGNNILREVAKRLKVFGVFTARITNDEFGVILTELENTLEDFVKELLEFLSAEPYQVDRKSIFITFSAGAVEYSADINSSEEVYTLALHALSEAKELGGNTYIISSKKSIVAEEFRERVYIRSELIKALNNKEFRLFYQPKVDLKTERVIGAEALIRWLRKGEIVPPGKFIPILEEGTLIHKVGLWVIEEVCNFLNKLRSKRLEIPIALNISTVQLRSETFLQDIEEELKLCGESVSLIEFEVTEGAIMENPKKAINLLNKIKEKGIRIYIDDFGTKYASLSYLKRIPAYALKIDISFIKNLTKEEDDLKMVKAIILLAKTFNLKTVAEGIETKEQLEVLRELGCDYGQGYYFSKPLPEEEFIKLLEEKL